MDKDDYDWEGLRAALRKAAEEHVESYPTIDSIEGDVWNKNHMSLEKIKAFLGNFGISPGKSYIGFRTFEKAINAAAAWHGTVFAQRLADSLVTMNGEEYYHFLPETWEEVCEMLADADETITLEDA